MKKLASLVLVAASISLIAASVHFVTGPTLTDIGTQLVLNGKLSGLGVGDVTILLSTSGVASVECSNPAGNVAPGQDTNISAGGSATFPNPKNGTLTFSVTTLVPNIPSSACPNNKWDADALDVTFSSGVITVLQGGVVVLQQSF